MRGRRGRRRKQLMHGLKETVGYCKLKRGKHYIAQCGESPLENTLANIPKNGLTETSGRKIRRVVITVALYLATTSTHNLYIYPLLQKLWERQDLQFCCMHRHSIFFFRQMSRLQYRMKHRHLLLGIL